MTVANQGDVVKYGINGTTDETAQGVVIFTPGQTSPLGTSGNPLVTQTSSLQTTADLTTVRLAISTATQTPVVTATASQKTRAYRWRINVAGAQVLTIQSANTTLEIMNFAGAGDKVLDFSTRPWHTTATNEALNITSSTTAATNVICEYTKNAQ